MKIVLLVIFLVTAITGVGLMMRGARLNREEGTKRYHPGNRAINMGLTIVIASGLALAMLGLAGA